MDRAAHHAGGLVGGKIGTGLYIDESAFAKKGDQSVGVAGQWNGRLGKQDNCQVRVFGALRRRDRAALVDARLYLPKDWTDDPRRCEPADVPRAEQIHRTKLQLAHEIIRHAREFGVRFERVGADGGHGSALQFPQSLQEQGKTFLADIHSDRHIYLNDPAPYVPPQGLCRARVRYHRDAQTIEVSKWVKKQPASAGRRNTLRSTTKGELIVDVLHRRVWLWDRHSATALCWHLIVRREVGPPGTIKCSLCNARAATSAVKLARRQAQRFWIELFRMPRVISGWRNIKPGSGSPGSATWLWS